VRGGKGGMTSLRSICAVDLKARMGRSAEKPTLSTSSGEKGAFILNGGDYARVGSTSIHQYRGRL